MSILKNFTMNQIDVLSQLTHIKGIRDLARRNSMDPAAVSRLLKEVELAFGFKLAIRSKAGLTLTSEGQQVVKMAAELMLHLKKFEEFKTLDPALAKLPSLNFASRGFLTTILSGLIARRSLEQSQFRMRFLDSSPQDTLRAALAGFIDIAVHIEKWSWPESWLSREASTLTWGLVARYDHPIKSKVSIKDTQKFPFVGSSYLSQERVERSVDVFPLKWSDRRIGHESQTAYTSKAILLASDHIGFLPLVTLEKEIKDKDVRIIKVMDMQIVQMRLYLSLNQDRVSQSAGKAVSDALKELNDCDLRLAKAHLSGHLGQEASVFNKISL